MLIAIIAGFVVLAFAVAILTLRLNEQEHRIARLESLDRHKKAVPNLHGYCAAPISPLNTLHIVLGVEQDHSLSPFAERLAGQFRRHGAVVTRIPASEMANDAADFEIVDSEPDIVIAGSIVCNGYTDVCFKADLFATCLFGELPPLVRQYADGAPQQSVAIEAADFVAAEFAKAMEIHGRERAVRELSGLMGSEATSYNAHQQQHTR